MLVDIVTKKINALPQDLSAKVWAGIREIDAALEKAGPVALLALKYTVELHEKRVADLVTMQENRIKVLEEGLRVNQVNVAEFNRLKAEYEKTFKKLQRLKKKSK